MSVDPYKPPRVVHRHLAFADGGPLCLNTTPGLAACIAVGSLLGVEVLIGLALKCTAGCMVSARRAAREGHGSAQADRASQVGSPRAR